MNGKQYVYSNEIVMMGHPDKVCDRISAALLTEYLKGDSHSRCGIECVGGKGEIFITGEVTSNAEVDVEKVVKDTLKEVGYRTDYIIHNNIGKQSADIALGTNDEVGGAGDQGMMFGYACNDTKEKLPKAMVILQKVSKAYNELRKNDSRFLPDAKCQITGVYDEWQQLIKIKDFVFSYQNTEKERDKTDEIIIDLCKKICSEYGINEIDKFHINPTGAFLIGGFDGDSGLTGRKIVVDTYHGFCNVGGGCMNGKDPTKVDFSAHIKARDLAKKYLAQYPEKHYCQVQLSYAIGEPLPLAIYVLIDDEDYSDIVTQEDYESCSPKRMIKDLDLLHFDFKEAASFGFFRY